MTEPFHLIDFLSFVILFVLFIYVILTNEISQLQKIYIVFHITMMLWPFGMFSMYLADGPLYQWFYLNLAFLGISFLGNFWLLFSLILTRGVHRIPISTFVLLSLPSFVSAFLVTTNPFHRMFTVPGGENWPLVREYGPVFWYLVLVGLLYLLVSGVIMLRSLMRTKNWGFKRRVVWLLAGQAAMIMLVSADIVRSVWPSLLPLPFTGGFTSLGILISDLCCISAIRKNNAFRVVSIALREVVDSMDTGIVILDDRDFVLDYNAVAKRLFPYTEIGSPFPVEKMMEGALEPAEGKEFLMSYYQETGKLLQTEVMAYENAPVHVSVRITPIYSGIGMYIGRVVTLQDVTEWRSLLRELHDRNEDLSNRNLELIRMQEELSLANQRLEQLATTDPLTGCYNRRYLFQILEYQMAVERRYRVPFSFILFDIDHFKQINDTYGHHTGDEVLRQTAALIRSRLRESDVLARYGGEEFTIYLPYTGKKEAANLAEELRRMVENHVVTTEYGDISITISIGVVSVEGGDWRPELEPKQFLFEVIRQADLALYEAKKQGRNRVVVA